MRLLFLTAETCPTFRADVTSLFGKYLPRHGVFSDIVTGRTCEHVGPVEWGGGETHLFEARGGQARKRVQTLLHGIRHLISADRRRYQAIQVRDMPVLAAIGLVAARLKGLPFYYWMSYPMPEGQIELARERGLSAGWMKFLFPWFSGRIGRFLLYRFVLKRADHIFVQSARMKDELEKHGIKLEKMSPVPMGVDMENDQIDSVLPTDDPRLTGQRTLVYLGTLDRPRRIEILFEMLAEIRREIPNTLLVLVGDTEDTTHRKWLRVQASKVGIADAVLWTGWLPMNQAWRYVRAAEVGLSPIPRGPLLDVSSPTKLLEYFALGLPVVCSDNPDQEYVVSKSNAGICVPYTPRDFAEAVIATLNMEHQARDTMAKRGREYVATNRDYKELSKNLATVYLTARPSNNH